MIAYKLERRANSTSGLESGVKQALSDLEAATARALEQIALGARPAFRCVKANGNVLAQAWDLVQMREGGTVLLPEPSPQNRGVEIALVRDTASAVTVIPVTGLVNGASSDAPVASRLTIYVSTGDGWFSNA